MEPISTLLGICVGQAWDLTKTLGVSVGEALVEDKAETFIKTITKRLKSSLPENHDLIREIRGAELVAARRVQRAYQKWLDYLPPYEKSPGQTLFAAKLDDFLSARLKPHTDGGIDFQALSQERIGHVLDEMINAVIIEGAAEGAPTPRQKIESAFLAEIAHETDCQIPPDFQDFFTGTDPNIHPPQGGWYDMVALYITEEIKENERFKSIFFATELVDIKRLIVELTARIAAFTTQGVPAIGVEVKQLLRDIKGDTEKLLAGQQSTLQGIDEILAFTRNGGVFQRAAEQGISEAAIRGIVERLGGQNIELKDLVPWLDNWIEAAVRELNRKTNEGEAYEAAFQEAQRRFNAGRADAANAFMEEFEREQRRQAEQQAESRRKQISLLEGAIRFQALALNEPAIVQTLRKIAQVDGIEGADALGNWLFAKASEFQETGESRGSNPDLFIAIAAYCAALQEFPRNRAPLNWAATQNNLGNALRNLGERESGTARLQEAVQAFRAALEEYTRDRVPLNWALAQNNLGIALARLGERESGTARLEEAVQAYRAALEERTRDRVPLDWAGTQNNLGSALAKLGERESSTARLEEAAQAFRAALQEYTRYRKPLNWAMTQNNLGAALQRLGERESGTARLEEAVQAFRAALEERIRDRVPLDWAMTQNNLGNALTTLGERESGTARLEEAVEALRAALEEHTRDRVPLAWAMTQHNLGNALQSLGVRENGTVKLEEAVQAYRLALQERTRDRVPLHCAQSHHCLADALAELAKRQNSISQMAEALTCMENAVDGYTQCEDHYWRPVAERRVAEIAAALAEMRSSP